MTRHLRPFAAILLAFVLVLTAQSMAVARGAPDVAGAITLCTGTGPVTLLTDRDGQPLGAAHICPDCSLTLGTGPAACSGQLAVMLGQGARVLPKHSAVLPDRAPQPFSARDPPVAV